MSMGTRSNMPRVAMKRKRKTRAKAISCGQVRSQRRAAFFFASAWASLASGRTGASSPGLPSPMESASLGQALMQSEVFMQPASTTMPKCLISSWTRTLEVQAAVQRPHSWHLA